MKKAPTYFKNFISNKIFAWQHINPEEIASFFETTLKNNKNETLITAGHILDHEFKVFNCEHVFKKEINWHKDPFTQNILPQCYWKSLDYWNSETITEVKYVWEFNRHNHFVTLARAYYLTKDEKYTQELLSQWSSWIDQNPYLIGINWTSSLECALRLVSWTWALQFTKECKSFNSDLFDKIACSVKDHGEYIYHHLSKYSSANNHLIGEAIGLIYAGCYYPFLSEAKKWRNRGFHILFNNLPKLVYSDGVCKEQTPFYQVFIFNLAVLGLLAAQHENRQVPKEFLSRMEKMADFIYTLMDRHGNVPNIGDNDHGYAVYLSDADHSIFSSMLSISRVLFNRDSFQDKCNPSDETAFWLLGEKSEQSSVSEHSFLSTVTSFPEGGYYIITSDSQPHQQIVFDCGPLGFGALAAHGHADALSVMFSVNGQPVLIDSGTYMYLGAREHRNYFRGTDAHNTLVLNKKDQSEPLGPFQWGRKADSVLDEIVETESGVLISGYHNGYKEDGVIHHRKIEWNKYTLWTISDTLHGKKNHDFQINFHLSPCELICNDVTATARYPGFDVLFSVKTDLLCFVQKTGWHSENFGEKKSPSRAGTGWCSSTSL